MTVSVRQDDLQRPQRLCAAVGRARYVFLKAHVGAPKDHPQWVNMALPSFPHKL